MLKNELDDFLNKNSKDKSIKIINNSIELSNGKDKFTIFFKAFDEYEIIEASSILSNSKNIPNVSTDIIECQLNEKLPSSSIIVMKDDNFYLRKCISTYENNINFSAFIDDIIEQTTQKRDMFFSLDSSFAALSDSNINVF